jgi:pyruvate kinase
LGEVERATPSGAWLEALAPVHRQGAINLRHYLALRRHDVRNLQVTLTELGLSSLGRAEGHVHATLLMVRRALALLSGAPESCRLPLGPDFQGSRESLAAQADALLGPAPEGRAVRIMVTADASLADAPLTVSALLERGMSCLRVNCAHDGIEVWSRIAKNLRAAEKQLGLSCRLLMDLGGPKIRTGPLEPGPAVVTWKVQRDALGRVLTPTTVWLVPPGERSVRPAPVLTFPKAWLASLREGELVHFRDARGLRRELRILRHDRDAVQAEAERRAFVGGESRFYRVGFDEGVLPLALPHAEAPIHLAVGDALLLTRSLAPGRPAQRDREGQTLVPAQIGCTEPNVFFSVKPGHRVLLDDGKFEAETLKAEPEQLHLRITRAPRPFGKLGAEKGINVPDTRLQLPSLGDDDRADLATVAKLADLVGLSFVQSPDDIVELRTELRKLGASDLGIILKIETAHAFASLPSLLWAAMEHERVGVMIARGDLAVECGYQRLAEVQEELLWVCEAAHLPTVWATQVLEGLAKTGTPSRAEVTDAAMGERAECVMLNKGAHILEAVSVLDDILRRMEEHQSKKTAQLRALKSWRLEERSTALVRAPRVEVETTHEEA